MSTAFEPTPAPEYGFARVSWRSESGKRTKIHVLSRELVDDGNPHGLDEGPKREGSYGTLCGLRVGFERMMKGDLGDYRHSPLHALEDFDDHASHCGVCVHEARVQAAIDRLAKGTRFSFATMRPTAFVSTNTP